MFKVIYHGKKCTVVDVKIECFDYAFHNGVKCRMPNKTWFLIYNDCFYWVKSDECTLYEGD